MKAPRYLDTHRNTAAIAKVCFLLVFSAIYFQIEILAKADDWTVVNLKGLGVRHSDSTTINGQQCATKSGNGILICAPKIMLVSSDQVPALAALVSDPSKKLNEFGWGIWGFSNLRALVFEPHLRSPEMYVYWDSVDTDQSPAMKLYIRLPEKFSEKQFREWALREGKAQWVLIIEKKILQIQRTQTYSNPLSIRLCDGQIIASRPEVLRIATIPAETSDSMQVVTSDSASLFTTEQYRQERREKRIRNYELREAREELTALKRERRKLKSRRGVNANGVEIKDVEDAIRSLEDEIKRKEDDQE